MPLGRGHSCWPEGTHSSIVFLFSWSLTFNIPQSREAELLIYKSGIGEWIPTSPNVLTMVNTTADLLLENLKGKKKKFKFM